jgi:hypothetical protein
MRAAMLPDDLWDLIDPLLFPPEAEPERRTAASIRLSLSQCNSVRSSQGIPWEMLPQELGCGETSLFTKKKPKDGWLK